MSDPPCEFCRGELALRSSPVCYNQGDSAAGKTLMSAYVTGLGIAGSVAVTVELSAKSRFRNRLKANLELRLVKPVQAEPNKLVLWNEVEAVGIVRLSHGSGHFTVHELSGAPFTATVKDSTVVVTPKSQGGGSFRIEDVCINGDPLDIPVKITDIHALVIFGLHSMEVGSEAEVSVDAVDEAGNSFSRAHGAYTSAVIESSDRSVLISKISGSLYHIRAFSVGAFSLIASAKSASGGIIYSRPHAVQVFSPFSLRPERITLIPESSFQGALVDGYGNTVSGGGLPL
ncbi:hypothetical protein Y032_0088g2195 [Ancylostoma ceylanicum]|uniref:Uncharacterized protein n=1 Tax=Ancylostoma ceylanicum TaxID=53326 RepID=A0A016TNT7_9BILA|nr:hypothetical protein Y032_0088g2195 [Ancylostoma ceylanicum]